MYITKLSQTKLEITLFQLKNQNTSDVNTPELSQVESFRYTSKPHTYIHTYFICHKLSTGIVQYRYFVDSNGRPPEKLVLIVLAAHYYIYNGFNHRQQVSTVTEKVRHATSVSFASACL